MRRPVRIGNAVRAGIALTGLGAQAWTWRRHRAEHRLLLATQERYRSVVEDISEVIFRVDGEGRWAFLNSAWTQITGFSVDETLGRPCRDFVHPDDRETACASLDALLHAGTGRRHLVFRHLTADGGTCWVEVRAHATGAVPGIAGTITDITERHAAEERLAHLATHDGLTGLPNRAAYLERLDRALARSRRTGALVGVLFLDVDGLKATNDAFGHEEGDELLRTVARALDQELRATDTAARLGGDEFAVLCEDVRSIDDAMLAGERVVARIAASGVAASVGVAVGTGESTSDALLHDADAAMYRAKQRGRNRCELFDESMRTSALERLRIERALAGALEDRGQLSLRFQPVVDLGEGRIIGFEALLRWHHPELGSVSPAEFIPAAERTGAIVPIGEWVLREACRCAADWDAGLAPGAPPLGVSVNLSARQLAEPDVVDIVRDAVAAAGIAPGRLSLEITESVLLEDDERTAHTLAAIRALGVRLVLDDFGTGYSSLSYLKRYAFDEVKVDRRFIAGLDLDASGEAIVVAMLGMAHALGMDVVAEGVEHEAQRQHLARLGCERAQGWHLGRPVPPDRVAELLAYRSAAGQTIR